MGRKNPQTDEKKRGRGRGRGRPRKNVKIDTKNATSTAVDEKSPKKRSATSAEETFERPKKRNRRASTEPEESLKEPAPSVLLSSPLTENIHFTSTPTTTKVLRHPFVRKFKYRKNNKVVITLQNRLKEQHHIRVEAILVQERGKLMKTPCTCCSRDLGPCSQCIVLDGIFRGACANCAYGRTAKRCTFHHSKPKGSKKSLSFEQQVRSIMKMSKKEKSTLKAQLLFQLAVLSEAKSRLLSGDGGEDGEDGEGGEVDENDENDKSDEVNENGEGGENGESDEINKGGKGSEGDENDKSDEGNVGGEGKETVSNDILTR